MKLIKLTKPEEFLNLEKNDQLLIEWTDYFVKHHQAYGGCGKIMHYYVVDNKKRCDEIILRTKGNHYMNWKMFLGLDTIGVNTSQAINVYKVEVSDEEVSLR